MEQEKGGKKAIFSVFSGDQDKLFCAFVMATEATAYNMEVSMFFTFWGMRAIKKDLRTGKSLFGRLIGTLQAGDMSKASPSRYGFLGLGRSMFARTMRRNRISSLLELRTYALDAGIKFYACPASMKILEIERQHLIDEVEIVGIGTIIEKMQQSEISLFI